MHIPEYTITSEILKNIAGIEYSKAIIETQKILPHWQQQLQKEATIRVVKYALEADGYIFDENQIKKYLDNIAGKTPQEIKNFIKSLDLTEDISQTKELDETDIKNLHRKLAEKILPDAKLGRFRSNKIENGTNPEEILAEIVELFDWYNSLDAKEAHPVITSGIMLSQMEKIKPFDAMNSSVAKLTSRLCLKIGGYGLNNYFSLEEYFEKNKMTHLRVLETTADGDLTEWIEYFTDAMSREISNIKEKVILLARDTKIAKATGRILLTKRQERIVEFLQDYGVMQNQAFVKLFPNVSEDSVLRDLKVLIDEGIVVKRGKTKSSRYELK